MAAIAGSPNMDSYLYSQKLPFLYSRFHPDLFFKHSWDWTFADIRYRLGMICHKPQSFKVRRGRELTGH